MNVSKTNIGLMMAAFVAVAIGSTYALTADFYDYDTASQGLFLTGNVKVTHYDGDGNILAYRQTGNHIVAQGMELIMRQVFDDINQTAEGFGPDPIWPVAPLGTSGQVKWMEIGIGGENRLLYNDTNINTIVVAGCLREDAHFLNVSSDYGGFNDPTGPGVCVTGGMQEDCRARMNVTAMASFSGMTCASVLPGDDIDEAGMFNHAISGSGEMFSRNTFGGVVLQAPDTLTLDWEFTFSDAFP